MNLNTDENISRILVVDDEEDICFLIKSILKRVSSAQVDICTTVSDAFIKMHDHEYDLTFFDMRLNDGTGKDLINYVHNEVDFDPYIAVISAYTSHEDLQNLEPLNYDKFIPKPLSREKIINCLQEASQ